jgi:hypothetical protein
MASARAAGLATSIEAGAAVSISATAKQADFFMEIPPLNNGGALGLHPIIGQAVFDQPPAWRDRSFRARPFESSATGRSKADGQEFAACGSKKRRPRIASAVQAFM